MKKALKKLVQVLEHPRFIRISDLLYSALTLLAALTALGLWCTGQGQAAFMIGAAGWSFVILRPLTADLPYWLEKLAKQLPVEKTAKSR